MSKIVKINKKYCILPFKTVQIVKELKINKQPSKLETCCNKCVGEVNTKKLVH